MGRTGSAQAPNVGVPSESRTRVRGLRGRCPRPARRWGRGERRGGAAGRARAIGARERVARLELALSAWKAAVLPLDDARERCGLVETGETRTRIVRVQTGHSPVEIRPQNRIGGATGIRTPISD